MYSLKTCARLALLLTMFLWGSAAAVMCTLTRMLAGAAAAQFGPRSFWQR